MEALAAAQSDSVTLDVVWIDLPAWALWLGLAAVLAALMLLTAWLMRRRAGRGMPPSCRSDAGTLGS